MILDFVFNCCLEAFDVDGAKLWNSLEKQTKLAPSLKTFKNRLFYLNSFDLIFNVLFYGFSVAKCCKLIM